MTFPSLPFDSSVKFLFYSGIFLTVFSIYKLDEYSQNLIKSSIQDEKWTISRKLDKEITNKEAGILLDTSKSAIKPMLLKIQLEKFELEKLQERGHLFLILASSGIFLMIMTMGTITKNETKASQLMDLELKIKKLEYEKKLNEQKLRYKYIRIRG